VALDRVVQALVPVPALETLLGLAPSLEARIK
jgi:hypothetical protein